MASAAKVGKKTISQNELRRIMNEQKMKLTQTTKKVESPLARYSARGQLSCILCDSPVKNEGFWTSHLASKQHLANIASAKRKRAEVDNAKRPSSSTFVAPPEKKQKSSAPEAASSSSNSAIPFDSGPSAPVATAAKPTSQIIAVPPQAQNRKSNAASASKSSKKRPKEEIPEEETDDANNDELPEGFFDDPKLDAKVRNVEYKDPVEEEWDKFMKTIKEESQQSHQIIQDDQEESTAERQLEEIDEQMRNWSRVIDLEKKKEEVDTKATAADKIKKEQVSDSDSDAEGEFDEFLDWRAKHS